MGKNAKKQSKAEPTQNQSFNDARVSKSIHKNAAFGLSILACVVIVLAGVATATFLVSKKKPDSNASQTGTTCPVSNYGSSTLSNVTVPATGRYKIWVRIMAPDATNNSHYLAINGDSCYVVGDNAAIPANTWTWVDYENGSTTSKMLYNFNTVSGNTVKLVGKETGVSVDRIILLAETDTCVPDNTRSTGHEPGDNCQPVTPTDTTPPTTSLTAPTASAVLKGTVNLSANAADNVGVTKVEFYQGTTKIGEDTSSPYTFAWVTTAADNGVKSLTSKAIDAANNSTSSSAVSVTIDNTAPAASISAPANGASVSGTVAVNVTATDAIGISKVEVFRGATKIGEDTSSPYSVNWNTASSANGAYALTAIATDTAGNATTSGAVNVTVSNTTADTTAPSVPSNLRSTSKSTSTVALAWNTATDNVGVAGYKVFRGGVEVTSVTGTTYTDTSLTANTAYSYTVLAYDAVGNESAQSTAVSVTTDPLPDTTGPTTAVTAPASGQTVSGNVNIAATATDASGIQKVEFYQGTTKIGEDTTSPYGIVWSTTTVTNGTYVLTVRAYDNSTAHNMTISNGVTVTVSNATTPPGDTTKPSTPSGLNGKAGANGGVTVNWTVSTDNVGVSGYNVYRDGVLVGTTPTNSFNDAAASGTSVFKYKVEAFDAAGNKSDQTAEISVQGTRNRKAGDATYDGIININDLSVVISRWNTVNDLASDLNGDGKTNIFDLSIVISNWGK